MTEGLGEHTTLTEDLSLVLSVHIRHLTTACISGPWEYDAVLLSLKNLHSHTHILRRHRHTYSYYFSKVTTRCLFLFP